MQNSVCLKRHVQGRFSFNLTLYQQSANFETKNCEKIRNFRIIDILKFFTGLL